jgi:DNA-binding transcriptional MerR regulator
MKTTKKIWTADSAAPELGVSVRHLRRYMRKLGMEPDRVGSRRKLIFGTAVLEQLRQEIAETRLS